MDIYTIVLIVHLLCAIIFIGYVFADVMILPAMNGVLDEKSFEKVKNALNTRARKVFPVSVLILILSGGFMLSKYINSNLGFFESSLQQLLVLKVILALVIVSGIIYSLSCKVRNKKPHAIMQNFHKFALVLGLAIVIIAKLMFVA